MTSSPKVLDIDMPKHRCPVPPKISRKNTTSIGSAWTDMPLRVTKKQVPLGVQVYYATRSHQWRLTMTTPFVKTLILKNYVLFHRHFRRTAVSPRGTPAVSP